MKAFIVALVLLVATAANADGPPPLPYPPPPVAVVAPPPPPIPPLGWVYSRYVDCGPYGCVVGVWADGVNVRTYPNGHVFLSLTNGVPLVVLQWRGPWALIAVPCNLGPTGLWSDTAGVPLNTCY